MSKIKKDNNYSCLPFWSWNDKLDKDTLLTQIEWMSKNGVGGFFMHARGGLITKYLSKEWFDLIDACIKKANELNMDAYAYDENGWPSGFVGGKLLKDINNRDTYLTYKIGNYDNKSFLSYDLSKDNLCKTSSGKNVLNVYLNKSNSTVDILNPKVVDQFIKLTHEQYKLRDTKHLLKGFFTDEPQYYRWGVPYTIMLEKEYKNLYHQNLLDNLGLLFVKKEGYQTFRYRYWKLMQSLMLNNYAKKIYNWCDKNGYIFTGHYIEESSLAGQMMCCAGIMPFYEYEHIPGIDWLGRRLLPDLASKQVGSVASQLNKKHILTETFAMVGWDATPLELKHIAETQYVNGVNLMCQHLLPYSEHGQRKRDYPEHFSVHNPWVNKHFKEFNDYFTKLGKLLSNSKELCNVGVIHPIRSCYFNYDFYDKYKSIEDIANPLNELISKLMMEHIPFHFLDETLIEKHGRIKDNKFILGKCTYDYIIIPKVYTLDNSTFKLIKKYISNGGKILFYDIDSLKYIEGKPSNEFKKFKTNTNFNSMKNSLPFKISSNEHIKMSYRCDKKNKEFLYLVNNNEETNIKINNKNIFFNKWESKIIYLDDIVQFKQINKNNLLVLNKNYKVENKVNNFLTLDKLSYSKDGINYSKEKYHMAIFDTLLKERYKGNLYLKYKFSIKDIPPICFSLIENNNVFSFMINGVEIKKHEHVIEKDLFKYDIAKFLKRGNNEIIIKIKYYQNDDVYYALFGENVTESLRNCLVYQTTIESIYLMGNFGVSGKFKDINDDIILGNNFILSKQKENVTSLIKDGFCFYRGEIVLSQEIDIKNTNKILFIKDRFQTIEVYVNNKYCGLMMFSNYLDISKWLVKGKNKITLKLIVSNRNLLGPSHDKKNYENCNVTPNSFEMLNSWVNGKNDSYMDDYTFVKTII